MTTPAPSPTPSGAIVAGSPSRTPSTAIIRLFLLGVSVLLVLPGFIVFGVSGASTDPKDVYFVLEPLTRLSLALLAGAILAIPFVHAGVLRLKPSWKAALAAQRRRRVRHLQWLGIALWWEVLIMATAFATLAFTPREILLGWYTPTSAMPTPQLFLNGVLPLLMVTALLLAILPSLILRVVDRQR